VLRERQDETQFCVSSKFQPHLNANVIFLQVFFESHPIYDQAQGSGAVFPLLQWYRWKALDG
jgi:hypothetical protein